MAELSPDPLSRYRHKAYDRARRIYVALVAMRSGGTAQDVAKVLTSSGERCSADAARTALWHLCDLGLVSESDDGICRWWTIRQP